jgi:hypothetical protein
VAISKTNYDTASQGRGSFFDFLYFIKNRRREKAGRLRGEIWMVDKKGGYHAVSRVY